MERKPMTEKEKMLNGLLYFPGDPQLDEERTRCKDLCHRYNSLLPSQYDEADKIMREILGRAEGDFYFTAPFYCDYGYNIEIGDNFYSNHNLVILDCAKVKIGKNVMIGPNCGIYAAGHPLDPEIRRTGKESSEPVTIEDDVWIGGGVHILPGITIGKGSVIGAGSVVTHSVPPYTVAVGNPARPIKQIQKTKGQK